MKLTSRSEPLFSIKLSVHFSCIYFFEIHTKLIIANSYNIEYDNKKSTSH